MTRIKNQRFKEINYSKVLDAISDKVKNYLIKYKIKSLVIGVSGGLDSGINSAILYPICKELGIPLIGRYIHIESNKEEEKKRAEEIGKAFCTNYDSVDLTELYHISLPFYEEKKVINPTFNDKIRRGNIKARMRMIKLYNIAQENSGIVVDNDNMTEHLLGFWTLNGDVGDITLLASLYKTEVFEFAKFIRDEYKKKNGKFEKEITALDNVINAVPTDGLGITSSDVEQFGAKSYEEVDDILITYKNFFDGLKLEDIDGDTFDALCEEYGKDTVDKVIQRHLNSNFKRNHPFKIFLTNNDMF